MRLGLLICAAVFALTAAAGGGYLRSFQHFDERGFLRAVENAVIYDVDGHILGATVPHFMPAMNLAANLLKTVAAQDEPPDTVFLIGPNHAGLGLPIIFTDHGWATPFGYIEPCIESVNIIANSGLLQGIVNADIEFLEIDHSLATVAPFVKYYLPDANIVTIMLSRGSTMEELDLLARIIYDISLTRNILLLVSVDFSHYLDVTETVLRDIRTDEVIRTNDFAAMKDLCAGYLDAPDSMIVLMKYSALHGAEAALADSIVLPESDRAFHIGFSYHVYVFTQRLGTARLVFVGDILLDGAVSDRINAHGLDSVFPPVYRGPLLNADIVMANLEMPVSRRGTPAAGKDFTFRGDPAHLPLLNAMNVGIVSLANNHALDYGFDAFFDTMDLLAHYGIKHVGGGRNLEEAGRPVIIEANGINIAFLAASQVSLARDWYASADSPGVLGTFEAHGLRSLVKEARAEADFVVVYLHWGVQHSYVKTPEQRKLALDLINSGADIVLGAHAHVLQGFEFHNGGLIAYNLGNFIFVDSQRNTAALEISINSDGSFTARLHPYEITMQSTVKITEQARIDELRGHLNNISFNTYINDTLEIVPDWAY